MTNITHKRSLRAIATVCLQCAVAVLTIAMSSCSTDYVNVIPKGSTALMSLDLAKMASQSGVGDDERAATLKDVLGIDDANDCGIDLKQKVYAFETPDGTLGMVAAVSSKSDVEKWIGRLVEKRDCTKPTEKKGYSFTVLHGSFVMGYSSDALLIMGPSVGSAQAELQRRMAKCLKADEDNGIKDSPMFDRLEAMDSPVALVAQAQALPDKMAALFTIGAPKGASPSDIYIAAAMRANGNGRLDIEGESFAFAPTTDKALKDASNAYKPIGGHLLNRVPTDAAAVLACGINGETYISQLRGNDAIRALLTGLNAALDVDKMIKSIDGDVIVAMPNADEEQGSFLLVAQASNADWLGDVDYWKKSCPSGSTITNGKTPNTFILKNSECNICFGHNGKELFVASSEDLAKATNGNAQQPATPAAPQGDMIGRKLCAMANVRAIVESHPEAKAAINILKPFFGNVDTVVFSMK